MVCVIIVLRIIIIFLKIKYGDEIFFNMYTSIYMHLPLQGNSKVVKITYYVNVDNIVKPVENNGMLYYFLYTKHFLQTNYSNKKLDMGFTSIYMSLVL